MAYRVFDDRTDETIFEAFESEDCVWFIECNYDEMMTIMNIFLSRK